jgi:hypothetical protein
VVETYITVGYFDKVRNEDGTPVQSSTHVNILLDVINRARNEVDTHSIQDRQEQRFPPRGRRAESGDQAIVDAVGRSLSRGRR